MGSSAPYPPVISSTTRLKKHHVPIIFLCMAGYTSAACVDSECGPAEGWDNFANNLGSDLAPLLALFGEQVTKQFMSESLSWIDCLIFSLAPLGIITAIVSAIRVGGGPRLRSLVGRAKESRGEVEADLMSSTSLDVCELWNGEGVVRVLGRPVLLQLIYEGPEPLGDSLDPPSATSKPPGDPLEPLDDSSGLHTFQEAIYKGLYHEKGKDSTNLSPNNLDADVEKVRDRQNPPNLSLNVSMVPLQKWVLVLFIIVGILLQGGVLVYAAVVQYILRLEKNNTKPVGYGFPLFVAGTLVLAVGMFLCAKVVDLSTEEKIWVPSSKKTGGNTVIWLQQGGQTVGDQRFESFARRTSGDHIITSHKPAKVNLLPMVIIGISTALLGFFMQFIALRVMHSSVTAAQLGAVLVMTAIRSCTHIQRESGNDIKDPEQVEGHELDWLAKDLKGCKAWEVISGPEIVGIFTGTKEPGGPIPSTEQYPNIAMEVMKIRTRLAGFSKDWKLENRNQVGILQNAIESTMDHIYSGMVLKDVSKDKSQHNWALPVKAQLGNGTWQRSEVSLNISRIKDQNGNWKPWKVKEGELEAVFCLWISSLEMVDRVRAEEGFTRFKNTRCISLASPEATRDYKMWIYRGTAPEICFLPPDVRYFGQLKEPCGSSVLNASDRKYLCINTELGLEGICAQELYTAFLFGVAGIIEDVGGETERRTVDFSGGTGDGEPVRLGLKNTTIALLADSYYKSGLGTIEEAYIAIVPALRATGKIPSLHGIYEKAKEELGGSEVQDNMVKAFELDLWLDLNKPTGSKLPGVPEVVVDIGMRLFGLTRRLLKIYVNRESSSIRQKGLMDLKDSWEKIDPSDFFQGILQVVKALYFLKGCSPDIVIGFSWFALQVKKELEAETLARLVWDGTNPSCSNALRKSRAEAAQILRTIYKKKGTFMPKKTRLYAENLGYREMIISTTKTDTTGFIENYLVLPDILLIEGWRTPLQAAAGAGDFEAVKELLDAKDDINDKPAKGLEQTALEAAAEAGDYLAKVLLENSAKVYVGPTGYSGRTALQVAAEAGHIDIVELLLKEGAEVNAAPGGIHGRTAFQAAAGAGHIDIVELLLKEGAEVNAAPGGIHGRTALQAAAGAGHIDIVELLLKEGAEVNAAPGGIHGRTAFQAAAGAGHIDIVELLLKEGAEVNAAPGGIHGRTAFQVAAEAGHIDIVELLLKEGAEVNAAPGGIHGRTAFQAAAGAGHIDIVELLLKEGAEVNAAPANWSGRTALQAAAGAGHIDIVELLLKEGAEVNAAPARDYGRTALQAAAGAGHIDIVELLLKEGAEVNAAPGGIHERTALQAAAEAGHIDIVELLLKEGAEVNAAPARGYGRTALQAAAGAGHIDIVELLLKEGAEVNAAPGGIHERTALQAAAEAGHIDIVELLLKEGAEVNAAPARSYGRTALQAAAGAGHIDIVELLLKEGAEVNAAPGGIHERTALQAAAEAGHIDIVELLLKEGAEVNAAPARGYGRTALQAAAGAGHIDIVELLLKEGAEVNAAPANWSGRTALQAAAGAGHIDIVELLLKEGAGVNAAPRGNHGRTALQAAAEAGHVAIVEILLHTNIKINMKTFNRETARDLALKSGHTKIVELLDTAI